MPDMFNGYGEEEHDPYDPWSRRNYNERLNPGYQPSRKNRFSKGKEENFDMPDWENDDWESDWNWDFDFGDGGEPDGDKDDKK